MIRKLSTDDDSGCACAATPAFAQKQRLAIVDANGNLDALIARHAAANNVPEDLVRRVIKRESGGNARVVSAGNYGLMQIKLADRPLHGLHRHRRRSARCRHQHDLCGEISGRRLSASPTAITVAQCTTMPPAITTPPRPRAWRSVNRDQTQATFAFTAPGSTSNSARRQNLRGRTRNAKALHRPRVSIAAVRLLLSDRPDQYGVLAQPSEYCARLGCLQLVSDKPAAGLALRVLRAVAGNAGTALILAGAAC